MPCDCRKLQLYFVVFSPAKLSFLKFYLGLSEVHVFFRRLGVVALTGLREFRGLRQSIGAAYQQRRKQCYRYIYMLMGNVELNWPKLFQAFFVNYLNFLS